jgi:hypothetical protein
MISISTLNPRSRRPAGGGVLEPPAGLHPSAGPFGPPEPSREPPAVADGSGNVTTWADRSGNGNDATPGISPTLTPNAIAGQPVVSFAGAIRHVNLPDTSTLGIASSDYEIFVVAQSGSSSVQFLTAGGTAAGNEDYELHLNGDAGARFIPEERPGGDPADFADIGSPGQFTDGAPHLFSIRVGADTGVIKADGLYSGDNVAGAQNAANRVLTLGVRGDGGYPLNGDIAEVLVYDRALTPSERLAVEEYLSAKWGTPLATNGFQKTETGGTFRDLNVAAQSAGATAFAKDLIAGGGYPAHQISHLNDEVYGNSNSWIGATDGSFAGVAFAHAFTIEAIAFGRDNGNFAEPGSPGTPGQYTDRFLGTYTLQYTTAPNPDASTPDSAWNTIEVLHYDGVFPDALGYLRHYYQFDPIAGATGVRILTNRFPPSGEIAIDELEVYAIPEPATLCLVGLGAAGLLRRRRR